MGGRPHNKTLLFGLIMLVLLVVFALVALFATGNSSAYECDYDVVIVGAGLSGLSALSYLTQHGVTNVVILEAKDRIGGRVYSIDSKYGPLEMGAQWIHGPEEFNSIFNLAKSYHLVQNVTCDLFDARSFYTTSGRLLDQNVTRTMYQDLKAIEDPPPNVQWEDYLNRQFAPLLQSYSDNLKIPLTEIFNTEKVKIIFDEGFELDQLYNDPYYHDTDCDLDLNGSNARIVNKLAEEGGTQRIHTGVEVKSIKLSKRENLLEVKALKGTTHNAMSAKYVIFTPSVAVLKNVSTSMFCPPLSPEKLLAVDKLQFGRGVKIFLLYSKPFWQRGQFGPLVLGITPEDYEEGKRNWVKRIVSFTEVVDVPNGLLTFVFGNSSDQVELLDSQEVGRIITERLRHYTGDQTIPLPDQVFKSDWIHDRFFQGTYTSPKVNVTHEDFDSISKSEMNGRLLFAGEATVAQYYSTMHGARDSGIREAKKVIELIKSN